MTTSQIQKLVKTWLDEGVSISEVLKRLNAYDNGTPKQKKLFISKYFENV